MLVSKWGWPKQVLGHGRLVVSACFGEQELASCGLRAHILGWGWGRSQNGCWGMGAYGE